MPMFRKKPVVIEARQSVMDDLDELLNATMAELDSFGFNRAAETVARASTEIERLRAEVEALRADAETKRGLLLWALYHSQGASSQVGQPIRRNLGIGRHERLTPEQIKDAERASQKSPCGECHLQPGEQCDVCGARAAQGVV